MSRISIRQTCTGHLLPAYWDGNDYRFLGRVQTDRGHRLRVHQQITPLSDWLVLSGNPVVDLATLAPYDRYQTNVDILNQKQVGSCVGHGFCAGMLKVRDLMGQLKIPLSADALYSLIDRDVDQGADPMEAVAALISTGICPLADVPDNFILKSAISTAAWADALRFRILQQDVYSCANFAEMVTADMLGFAVVLTVNVGNNFGPDASRVVGYTSGVANHCVSGGEKFLQLGGVPTYQFRNSWDVTWGGVGGARPGCAYIQAQHIDQQDSGEYYAIRYAIVDPLNPIPPLN